MEESQNELAELLQDQPEMSTEDRIMPSTGPEEPSESISTLDLEADAVASDGELQDQLEEEINAILARPISQVIATAPSRRILGERDTNLQDLPLVSSEETESTSGNGSVHFVESSETDENNAGERDPSCCLLYTSPSPRD